MKSVSRSSPASSQNNNYIGRPVDVLAMKDGSMLVSDDYAGAIYRVRTGKARKVAGSKR